MRRDLSGPQDHEANQHLALELVGDADGRGLGNCGMAHENRFHLRRPQALAGDLDGVVGAAEDVPKAVFGIDIGPVAVHPNVWKAAPVRLEVALAVAPEATGHARPRVADDKLTDLASNRLALGVDDVCG